jgi:hypothetical protein
MAFETCRNHAVEVLHPSVARPNQGVWAERSLRSADHLPGTVQMGNGAVDDREPFSFLTNVLVKNLVKDSTIWRGEDPAILLKENDSGPLCRASSRCLNGTLPSLGMLVYSNRLRGS